MNETARRLLARIETLDTAVAANQRKAEAYQSMADELKDVTGTGTSPDGVVTVVAGAGGGLDSISFGDRYATTPPETLAADVLHAFAEAQAVAAREQAEVVRRSLGSTELLDRVLASDEQLFGTPRTPAVPAAPPRRVLREAGGDEEFGEFSVFNR